MKKALTLPQTFSSVANYVKKALILPQTFSPVANYMNMTKDFDKNRKSPWTQTEEECSDCKC